MKEDKEIQWVLHTDGSTNVQEAGIEIILQFTNRLVMKEGIRLSFEVMNNKVEYKAFIYGLELARHLNIRKIEMRGDSTMVIGQMTGVFEVKVPRLKRYFNKASALAKCFKKLEIQQVPRELN